MKLSISVQGLSPSLGGAQADLLIAEAEAAAVAAAKARQSQPSAAVGLAAPDTDTSVAEDAVNTMPADDVGSTA